MEKVFIKKDFFRKGLTLAEVLVAVSILLAFIVATVGVFNFYIKNVFSNSNVIKASFLGEEGLEVVRFFRDVSWTDNIMNLDKNTEYSLSFDPATSSWSTSTEMPLIDGIFERKFLIYDVYRDPATDEITSVGGVVDPNTVLVVVSVSWLQNSATTTRSISTYLTNLFDN